MFVFVVMAHSSSVLSYCQPNAVAVTIRSGTFTWGDVMAAPVLSDVDMTVGKGKLVAVVGQVHDAAMMMWYLSVFRFIISLNIQH